MNWKRAILYSLCIGYILSAVRPIYYVDPELQPYLDYVNSYVNKYCGGKKRFDPLQQTIKFGELSNSNAVAVCKSNRITNYELVFNKVYWDYMDESERKQVFAHELFHAIYYEPHNEDPNHFMYAYMNYIKEEDLGKQLEAYLKEKCK